MGKYEDLENLNKLKSSGIISEQEFEDKKKLILAESKNDENKNQEIIKKYSSKAKKDNRKMIIVCSLIIGGAIFLFIILPQIYLSVKSAIEKSNEREIPNIEGMTVEEAKTQLEELDLILESDNNASDAIITYQKDKGKTKKGETVEVYAKTQEQINEEKQKEEERKKKEEEAKAMGYRSSLATDETIVGCAKQLISNSLLSSTTARWGTCEKVDEDNYGRCLVYVSLEAQNGFGAYVKKNYFVVLQNVEYSGRFTYKPYSCYYELEVAGGISVYDFYVSEYKEGNIYPIIQTFLDNNDWNTRSKNDDM